MASISDTIETNATAPKRMKGDREEAEQHSLPDQLEVEDRLQATTATKRKGRGLLYTKVSPPGTT